MVVLHKLIKNLGNWLNQAQLIIVNKNGLEHSKPFPHLVAVSKPNQIPTVTTAKQLLVCVNLLHLAPQPH